MGEMNSMIEELKVVATRNRYFQVSQVLVECSDQQECEGIRWT